MYVEFTKESKSGGGGQDVQSQLRLAQNCFVELLGLNVLQSYQFGFQFIRQLCLHLRNTRNQISASGRQNPNKPPQKEAGGKGKKKALDPIKGLYSWQFLNCVKVWVLGVCKHKNELVLLVHPLVQLITGAIKLSNALKYYPFHLKLIELLLLVNERVGEYVPVAQYLLHILEQNSHYFFSKPKSALEDKMIPESAISIKIAKKHVDTPEMRDRIIQEVTECLVSFYSANSRSLGFPEMTIGTETALRKFRKGIHSQAQRQQLLQFIETTAKTAEQVKELRGQFFQNRAKTSLDSKAVGRFKQFVGQKRPKQSPLEQEFLKIQKRQVAQLRMKQDKL
mmetsp:Transcript_7097/g.11957  ORF Transcript_7097/g.11957 Transcript_7097/m.11957 type:complete len:337 (-) Transcript_7097:6-1016(-)